jgi:hypothetical protein
MTATKASLAVDEETQAHLRSKPLEGGRGLTRHLTMSTHSIVSVWLSAAQAFERCGPCSGSPRPDRPEGSSWSKLMHASEATRRTTHVDGHSARLATCTARSGPEAAATHRRTTALAAGK